MPYFLHSQIAVRFQVRKINIFVKHERISRDIILPFVDIFKPENIMPNRVAVSISKSERIEKELEDLDRELREVKAEGNKDKIRVVKLKIEELLLELDDC